MRYPNRLIPASRMGAWMDEHYLKECNDDFWRQVFQHELAYLVYALHGCRDIVSIGCGPAIIESGLADNGFMVTGVDISHLALAQAPSNVRTVVADAENMVFPCGSFDAAIYIVSLQFISDIDAALAQTVRILRPGGKLVALLLNPESEFYRQKRNNPDSYVNNIVHADLSEAMKSISRYFTVESHGYLLGILDKNVFETNNPKKASLFCISGTARSVN